MNMKQLKYVNVLSRHNNFTRAAEELGISQPSLSQYVKKIEKQLGVELFIRVGQDVRLTDAGETYLRIGKQILDLENEMNHRIIDISNDQYGTLTIGIAPYRCTSLMPQAIKEFRKYYPGIKVVLSEQITSQLKESAEKGKLDLCVSTLPIDDMKFEYQPVMHEDTVLAVPTQLSQNMKAVEHTYSKVSIQEYKSLPFISLSKSQIMRQILDDLCEHCGISIDIAVECQDLAAVHSMVEQGVGAALLPYSLVRQHESDRVNYFMLEESTQSREIVVFYRKDQYLSKPMKKMIDILTKIYEVERQGIK